MSGAALDMTLEDLIKSNKKSSSRGRGRASGPGPSRRVPNRSGNRAAPYAAPKAPELTWNHDMFSAGGGSGGRSSSIQTGTKLYISNLDYGVSTEDIKELFAEVGDLKRCMVHYDKSGRSKGTAEVAFSRQQDALTAVKKYNNVQLDGKPMKIDIVGTNITTPAAGIPVGAFNPNPVPRSGQGRGSFGRSSRGRGSGSGRGRGQGKSSGEKVSVDDLDADLEKYHADAMQTND